MCFRPLQHTLLLFSGGHDRGSDLVRLHLLDLHWLEYRGALHLLPQHNRHQLQCQCNHRCHSPRSVSNLKSHACTMRIAVHSTRHSVICCLRKQRMQGSCLTVISGTVLTCTPWVTSGTRPLLWPSSSVWGFPFPSSQVCSELTTAHIKRSMKGVPSKTKVPLSSAPAGAMDPKTIDPRLISPFFDRVLPCLPKSLRRRLYCGVPHDRVDEFSDEAIGELTGQKKGTRGSQVVLCSFCFAGQQRGFCVKLIENCLGTDMFFLSVTQMYWISSYDAISIDDKVADGVANGHVRRSDDSHQDKPEIVTNPDIRDNIPEENLPPPDYDIVEETQTQSSAHGKDSRKSSPSSDSGRRPNSANWDQPETEVQYSPSYDSFGYHRRSSPREIYSWARDNTVFDDSEGAFRF